jgi:hypothetical protein
MMGRGASEVSMADDGLIRDGRERPIGQDLVNLAVSVLTDAARSGRAEARRAVEVSREAPAARRDPGAAARQRAALERDQAAARMLELQVAEIEREADADLDTLRLQMLMDRQAKMLELLSNTLKKLAETQQAIARNLK